MNLKFRSAILFGTIITVLLLIAFSIIYIQSEWFRKEDFMIRLHQKAKTTYNLLVEVQEIDHELLKQIDKYSLQNLYKESLLILNNQNEVIYSSYKDKQLEYNDSLIFEIRKAGYIEFNRGKYELVGLYINTAGKEGVVIVSAYDLYGRRKLSNLLYILTVCLTGSILITIILSYLYVKQVFNPLDELNEQIQGVGSGKPNKRLTISPAKSELTIVSENFNKMLDRLEHSFELQKNFLQHAAHELRTPLSVVLLQTEAALGKEMSNEQYQKILLSVYDDQKYMVELVNSILSLARFEQETFNSTTQLFRMDELLYSVIDEVRSYHPEYHIHFDFSNMPISEKDLMIDGEEALIKIVFANLVRNACLYSTDKTVKINLTVNALQILIRFYNNGPWILENERNKLFTPFFRGSNVSKIRGHGLGLSISSRIMQVHKGKLIYSTTNDGLNCFTVQFSQF